jgi:hypothetical protein
LFLPPPSLPIDPETAADAAPECDYTVADPSFAAELPGKQNPLDHPYIAHSFSPMLALEFATVYVCSYSDA